MKKTLLIVEDNLILCDILERWLQKAGYRVLTAIDEPSARRKIKGNNVALVLTDVRLPEGDTALKLHLKSHLLVTQHKK